MGQLHHSMQMGWTPGMVVIPWTSRTERQTHHAGLSISFMPTTFWCYLQHSHSTQTRLLQLQGNGNPNPKQQFITDLIAFINTWTHASKDVLLGMDVNEDVDNPRSHITHLFTENGLIDLHSHRHPAVRKPAMHQRGSSPIDVLAGTQLLADALCYIWILPFGMPALIKGDHHLLGADFDPDILFGTKITTPVPSLICGVNSNNKLHATKFCTEAIEQCSKYQLGEHIDDLMCLLILHEANIQELETIDNALTKILTRADKQCCPISDIPWSPMAQKAFIKHCYWTLCLAAFWTQCNLKSPLDSLKAWLPPEDMHQDLGKFFSAHQRQAQKQLHAAWHEAVQLCKCHLEEILNQAKAANHLKKTKAITYLIRAKQNCRCYAHYRHHTKPKAPGRLAFVTAHDDAGNLQPILDKQEMEFLNSANYILQKQKACHLQPNHWADSLHTMDSPPMATRSPMAGPNLIVITLTNPPRPSLQTSNKKSSQARKSHMPSTMKA